MTGALLYSPTSASPTSAESPARKHFTRTEFDRLMNSEIFEGQRYELIHGDLIDKMGQNPPHAYCLVALMKWLTALFGMDKLRAQHPIEVGEPDRLASFPEPDVAVIMGSSFEFRSRHPRGDELQLLIEVADTSIHFDLTVKAGLYARAGVREYWVLDVRGRAMFVHRGLRGDRYTQITEFGESDRVMPESMPEAMPGAGIEVRELLP